MFIERCAAANTIKFLFRRHCMRQKFKKLCLQDMSKPERQLEESAKLNCKKILQIFLRQKVLDAFSERKKQSKKLAKSAQE